MSLDSIPTNLLVNTISIITFALTKDSIGEFSEAESSLYTNVPAYIEPVTSDLEYNIQGKMHKQTHACYLNKKSGSSTLTFNVGDIVKDEDNVKYLVIGRELFRPANDNFSSSSHHIELILKRVTGSRYS